MALEYEPGQRSTYLDEACSNDGQLRSEVESLIAAYEHAHALSSPGWDGSPFRSAETPRVIGPYRLERELGVGGMGQVWLAEQVEPVRRYVALKLIRADHYNPQIAKRFLSERQSLALMNHPAIAKVFEAGTTPTGQPYLAMEYVDGCTITEYCNRNKLEVPQRLRLVQLICDGVQHAHQKAIIHRDLKPSNILVTEIDGKPMPRIIDFGIAKTVSHGADAETMFTITGSVIGTLGYMSPEQADGSEDIDTRCDVYSLGVILYELLTGSLPFEQKKFSYFEMLQQLREHDAARPSHRLGQSSESAAIAEDRKTETVALARLLHGDLDSITLKAIDRERNRRYATPSELSADIERFLQNQPVSAHGASFGYVACKYIRRHRAGLVGAAISIVLLVGFAIMQTLQLRDTRRQRDRADRITDFMTDMFKVSDPSESRGSSITAREILDRSSHQIETGLGFDASVQSQLLQVMAKTYMGLGLYGPAHDLAQRSFDSRRKSLGPENRKTLESMTQLSEILSREGRDREGEASLQKTIDLETKILGPDDSLTLQTQDDLASAMEKNAHYIEAEKLERKIIPIQLRVLGPADPLSFRSANNLATSLRGQSRFDEAEALLRKTLADERRLLGTDHPSVLVTMHNYANMLSDENRHNEAEALYRETLAIERRVLGPEHPDTASTMTTLANVIRFDTSRNAEAEDLYRQALSIQQRAVGPDHSYTTRSKEGLANVLNNMHRYGDAHQLLEEVLATRERTLGPENTDTLLTGYNLADVLFHQNRLADADILMRKTLARQIHSLDRNDPDIPASKTLLGRILLAERRPNEAENTIREAFDTQVKMLGPQHNDTQESLKWLTEALSQLGRYEEAQTLWTGILDSVAKEHPESAGDDWYDFAAVAALTGHTDDAFNALQKAAQAGFADADYLRSDGDMHSLHRDPRYSRALAVVQNHAQALASNRK